MTTESVKFDRAANYYDETRGFPPEVAPFVGEFIAKVGSLDQNSRVLEIGIGTGRVALPLAPRVQQVYGIDLSRPMMLRLHEKQQSEPISLAEADARELPFANQVFDAVIAVHVFHLIPNWRLALEEVGRVLRPAAPLILAGNMGQHNNEISQKLWDIWNAAVNEAPQNPGVNAADSQTFIVEAGWQPLGEWQSLTYSIPFSVRTYVDRLENRIWSRLWKMSDEQIATGVAAVKAYLLREYGSLDYQTDIEMKFYMGTFLPPDFA